jgi:hypothetical protein
MKQFFAKRALLASLFVMALGFGSAVRADQTYLLSQLLGSSGVDVTIGDKIFSDFSFTSNAIDANGNLIAGADPTKVFVTFKDPVNGTYNVLFHSASQFVAQNGGGEQDSVLSFFVSTTSGLPLIDGVDLGRGGVTGGGSVDIIEAVAYNGPPAGSTTISVHGPGGNLTDFATITPSSTVFVTKDIAVIGAATGTGITKITDFSQSFHQLSVPEPASCVLLGVGLLMGAAAWRRRSA